MLPGHFLQFEGRRIFEECVFTHIFDLFVLFFLIIEEEAMELIEALLLVLF